jgi:precorrin-3B synthase
MSGNGRVGWCPSVVTPMQAHDGLLVRVKPTASTLPAAALRAIAEAVGDYGNGLIDLTNRSNLQVRGLRPDTAEAFAEAVRAQGLASTDPALEEIRNVAADPLGRDDPDAVFDSHAIARAIEAILNEEPELHALPPKFGFLVDCGRTMPVADGHADIVIRDRDGTLTVALGGGTTTLSCTPESAPAIARQLALAFLDLAGPADAPPFRMRELVEAVGEPKILAKAGLAGRPVISGTSSPDLIRGSGCQTPGDARVEPGHDVLKQDRDSTRAAHLELMYAPAPTDSPIGFIPFPGRDRGAVVAGVPRGCIDAATLAALAILAERYADATVRMTPWRALAFVPVSADNAGALVAALSGLGLITDPSDPRRVLRGPDIAPAAGASAIPEIVSR